MKEYKFPKVLKSLLKKNKMTQPELAKKIGGSTNAISYWCRGEFTPSVYSLMAISELFGVSIDYLVTGEDTKSECGSSIKELSIWKSSGSR